MCVCVWDACVCVCMCACVRACTRARVCIHTYAHAYAQTHIHVQTYLHTYIYTYIHTHVCVIKSAEANVTGLTVQKATLEPRPAIHEPDALRSHLENMGHILSERCRRQ